MQVTISTSPLPFEVVISCPVPDSVLVIGSLPIAVTVTVYRDGLPGKSEYQSAVDNGFSGTEAEWIATRVQKTFDELRNENDTVTGDINFDNQGRIKKLLPAFDPDDAITLEQGRQLRDESKVYANQVASAITLEQTRQNSNELGGNINAAGNSIDNLPNAVDEQQPATLAQIKQVLDDARAYTDTKTVDSVRWVAYWDATFGIYPTGFPSAIKRGDEFEANNASVVIMPDGTEIQKGDVFRARINSPGQNAANWSIGQGNSQQADENNLGIVKIAAQAAMQNPNSTDDKTAISPLKHWIAMLWFKTLVHTWELRQIFTTGIRLPSLVAGQYLLLNANKDIIGQTGIPAADITGFDLAIANTIANADLKSNPGDADNFGFNDIVGGNSFKRISWYNIKTAIALYLQGLFTNVIINDTIASLPIVGTTANQMIKPYLMPTNIFNGTDSLVMQFDGMKTLGNSGTATFGVYLSTTPNLSGAITKIAGFNGSSGVKSFWCERRITFTSPTSFQVFNINSNNFYDLGSDGNLPSPIPYNVANQYYIITTIIQGTGGDTFVQTRFSIFRTKLKANA